MTAPSPVTVVQLWQDAANRQNIERLIELSDTNIEIAGPRGSGFGHELLRAWLGRAGLTLETRATFARESVVVLAQQGVWRSAETGQITAERALASLFRVNGQRVTQFSRHDNLEEALGRAGLSQLDQVAESPP
jgi:hypothetical protein